MKLIIHGGFFTESHTDPETKRAKQNALARIVRAGYAFLKEHTAAETVVHVVEMLEDDVLFNAGTGSQIQRDGHIRMSAALMDGGTRIFSGVLNIEGVQNPIRVASLLQHSDDRVLGGEMATAFARNSGIPEYDPSTAQRRAEYAAKKQAAGLGTVGCVALDASGKLAAATSTGGKGFELPGRISDSGTTAGNFANSWCGVSCTGVGEDIVSTALASGIVHRRTDGHSLAEAFRKGFEELKEIDGFAGAIAVDRDGNVFHQDSHPSMVFASFDGAVLTVFE